ncbi:MAG TPA: disulfide bond formation protein B [Methylomirabilota bacterium]|nr:disulfide bond formation protein B [Methylomirabilota bacterium]
MKKFVPYLPYIIFVLSLISTLASLYFSEVMKLVPCILCWYQRICMYPLVAISAVGILKKDKYLPYYILPLSLIGFSIALYHNLLYYHIIPESIAPCQAGISCTTRQLEWFGFFTIPLGSFIAFTFINICTIIYALSLQDHKVTKQSTKL